MSDEHSYLAAAQGGDRQALEKLLEMYQSQLYNAAFRILGEEEAAADATQEALISIVTNLQSFRGGSFRAWILRIVTNACYDLLRHKQRRPTRSLDALLAHTHLHRLFSDKTTDPEYYTLQQDLGKAIQRGLRVLNLDQRTAVVLSDIYGLSYPEIAEVVGVPVGTVKSRISRGRARLRDYLLQQEEMKGYSLRSPEPALAAH